MLVYIYDLNQRISGKIPFFNEKNTHMTRTELVWSRRKRVLNTIGYAQYNGCKFRVNVTTK